MPRNGKNGNGDMKGSYLTGTEYGRNNPHEVDAQHLSRQQGLLERDSEPTAMKTVKANYAIEATDRVVLVDAMPGNVRIMLPKAADVFRRTFIIKKIDSSANTVTIEANRNELIDGSATLVISTQYDTKRLYAGKGGFWSA